jgi:hypothetical protein
LVGHVRAWRLQSIWFRNLAADKQKRLLQLLSLLLAALELQLGFHHFLKHMI